MKSNAQVTADKPRRGHSLVLSMMMILTALSAGISGIPLANATGNGEWVTVHMTKGHWDSGEDVDATIKAESLNSSETYYLSWNVETVGGNNSTSGSATLSDSDGDGVEEHAVTIAATDLFDECWDFYADLYDSNGTLLSGSSFTFDVGTGMCQGGGPTGPSMWWNGDYWWDANESVAYTAEISGLDESLQYSLDWSVSPHDDQSVVMASDSVDLTGLGAEPSVLADVGELGDGCYEIQGMLFDADSKDIPGSGAHYLFEVGSGICQTGQMSSVMVSYYDGELGFMGYGFENDSVFNVQISITGADGSELYSMDSDFTTDEYGMFNYSDSSISFEDGEYPVLVKVFNQAGDLVFEDDMITLYVYSNGGGDGPTIYAWLDGYYESGDEIIVGYYIDTGTGGGQGGDELTYVCGNGDEIPFSWVNDGDEDCSDGSDEPQDMDSSADSDGDGNFTNDHDSWFDCNDANQTTVNMDLVNNGNWDCENGADEGEAAGPPPMDDGEGDFSATLNLYDDMDSTLLSTYDLDMNSSNISLGVLGDGDYKVEVILEETDAAGDTWEVDNDGFHFCLGEDCEGGGPPDMLTGSASLDLSITFGDYDSANCMGGFVMLFDWYDLYMDMMSGPDDGGDEDDGGDPVWFDWMTVTGPGNFTLTGLPEGDWVVIVSIGCEDPDTGEEYGAMNIDGPWSLYNTTFVNDTTTTLAVDLQIMEEGGPGDGDDMDYETGEIDFTIRIDDSADGYTALTLTQKVWFSDFFRDDIDCGFGDCNGEVSETESANAIAAYMLMGPGSGDDDGGDEECPFDSEAPDSPCNNQDCMDQDSQECMNAVMAYCQDHPDDPGCDMDGGPDDDDDGMGTPEFMWNGVLLTEADMISGGDEDVTISGLVGDVPQDESEDTGSVAMTWVFVYMLVDSGEATQVLTPAPDNDGGDDWCPFDPYANNSPCSAVDENGDVCDWDDPSEGCLYQAANYCNANWDEHTMEGDYGCDGEWSNEDNDGCETINAYVEDTTTWTVASITGGDGVFTYDATAGNHHAVFNCDDEIDGMAMTFAHVGAEEPEPPVNQPPYCDVYYYAEASDLADFQSTEDKATGSNGTWEVSIVEDDTYWLMFYCMDDESDSITVNVTSAFGDYGETFAAGSTEGYYELTIPTGSSALSPYTLAYTWSDGTNSGSGTVTVTVSPADGGSDGSGDETEGEDTSAGSFVPGFTAVLTMTALAGAFLVFSRREED